MKSLAKFTASLLAVFLMAFCCADILPQNASISVSAAAAGTQMLNYTSLKIAPGQRVRLKANTSKTVKWGSADKNIAKISSNGYVTGVSAGTVKIRAKIGSKSYYCKVEVVEPTTDMLFYNMAVGTTYKIPGDVTTGVKWYSTNPYVATVSSKGTVKVLRKGTAKIYAEIGGKKYLKRCVYSIDDYPIFGYQYWSVPSSEPAEDGIYYPNLVMKESIASILTSQFGAVDMYNSGKADDGTMIALSEGTPVKLVTGYDTYAGTDTYIQAYKFNYIKLSDNTLAFPGDKFGNMTLKKCTTWYADSDPDSYAVPKEYNNSQGLVVRSDFTTTGTATFDCEIRYGFTPDSGWSYKVLYESIADSDKVLPSIYDMSIDLSGSDKVMNRLGQYFPEENTTAKFRITIKNYQGLSTGYYGYTSADLVSFEYLGR